jgi:hypothetical protein
MGKSYHNVAAGWLKENQKTGAQYISAMVDKKVKLTATLENGQVVDVTNFAVFFAEEGTKKNPKAPDVRFTFSTES